jgi:hypothetical protein
MKKYFLLLACGLWALSASAQTRLTLYTAPLGKAPTVILPTYDNLLKLRMADIAQFDATMKYYGYIKSKESPGSYYPANDADYSVSREQYKITIFFLVNTVYPQALEDEIKKKFPDTVPRKPIENRVIYDILINNASGQFIIDKIVPGDDDEGSGGAIFLN